MHVSVGQARTRSTICDTSEVDTSVADTTRTDRNIAEQHVRARGWEAAAVDPLTPRPIRDRAAAHATRARAIIERHERERSNPPVKDVEGTT
jgi:hypothetical protein